MITAYCALHRLGHAHSLEVWYGDELAGGVYGVALGRVFFGESMFSRYTSASKHALFYLCQRLRALGVRVLDCQVESEHVLSLGAESIPRSRFVELLESHCDETPPTPAQWRAPFA
jgi:leucyl/phenylalanyl-tRNA--protein transferase